MLALEITDCGSSLTVNTKGSPVHEEVINASFERPIKN